jgi:hypothetical protein
MKIRFGKSIIDGSDAPIAIFLTAEERRKIAEMPDDKVIYCDYPEGQYSVEEINNWLGVRNVPRGPVQNRPTLCCECGKEINEGDAVRVDEEGDPIHIYCEAKANPIGTMRGGEVKFAEDMYINHDENKNLSGGTDNKGGGER